MSSIRIRFLAVYVGLLTLATAASVVIADRVLVHRLDQHAQRDLVHETQVFRRFAAGTDPTTGKPYGENVRRVFRDFLQQSVPMRDEALLTFVEGRPFLRNRVADPRYRLDRDRALVARWATLETSLDGTANTPVGRIDYLAVPVKSHGTTRGVFVVARFLDAEIGQLETALLAIVAVGGAALVVGSLLAWRLASKVLRPAADVTAAARSISHSDLSRRIPVTSNDEVGELAATFNEMLGRLESAFRSQRQFVDDAGHELKTPLTIIRGHLELLEDDPQQRRETLVLVMDEIDRMSRIVNDLLLLTKHEQPDFLALATVDVGDLTDDVYAKVSGLAPTRWALEHRGSGVIVADAQRLTQAMLQLAQNAVHHSGDTNTLEIGSIVADGEARFWVRDHGRGVPLAEQHTIFDRFSRGRSAARSEGAGLGLAIVKAIAEAHGGRVHLDSEAGVGSTFSVVVPVDHPADHEKARAS